MAKRIAAVLLDQKPKLSIHRPAGLQATASLWSASISPSWILRRVNRALAGR